MEEKKDLRIIKTDRALFSALVELMKTKTFEEIKILDICNLALVNRSTFYAHYNDKYELLVSFIDELKENLLANFKRNENEINTKKYFMEMLEILMSHIDEKRELYSAILANNRNGILIDILMDVANKDINERLANSKDVINSSVPSNVITKFYLGAILSIGMEWLRNNNKYTKEELINYFDILIPSKI